MIWIVVGAAVVGWLLGLLLQIGPVVHLLLVVAVAVSAVELTRKRAARGS